MAKTAKLGGVSIDVVYSEKPERSVKTTDHPVESGEPIVDHVEKQAYVLNITGIITGPDAAARVRKLEQFQDSGKPLLYVHRNSVSNVIIEMFNSVHDSNTAGGLSFTMKLKRIRIAKATPIAAMSLPTKSQAAKVGNKGLQQKTKPASLTPAQKAAANNNRVKGN